MRHVASLAGPSSRRGRLASIPPTNGADKIQFGPTAPDKTTARWERRASGGPRRRGPDAATTLGPARRSLTRRSSLSARPSAPSSSDKRVGTSTWARRLDLLHQPGEGRLPRARPALRQLSRSVHAPAPRTTTSPSGGSQRIAGLPAMRWPTGMQKLRPPATSRWRRPRRDTSARRPSRTCRRSPPRPGLVRWRSGPQGM